GAQRHDPFGSICRAIDISTEHGFSGVKMDTLADYRKAVQRGVALGTAIGTGALSQALNMQQAYALYRSSSMVARLVQTRGAALKNILEAAKTSEGRSGMLVAALPTVLREVAIASGNESFAQF